MPLLAVCVPRVGSGQSKPRVAQFHTNLWSFPTWRGRRFVVDFGLNLANDSSTGSGRDVDSVDLFLPFPLTVARDITLKLKDLTTAELIFNETCRIATNGPLTELDVGGKAYHLGDAIVSLVESHPAWSQMRVTFTPPIAASRTRYVRVRAYVDGSRRIVWSQGGGLPSTLTAYDIRFYEKRQWASDDTLKGQIAAMDTLDIDVCQCFLIVPAASMLVEHEPPMKSMRLLEAGEWGTYLDRNIERASVYYWKHGKTYEPGGPADSIGPHRPYRVYAKFRMANAVVVGISTWLPLVVVFAAGLAWANMRTGLIEQMSEALVTIWDWAVNNRSVAFLLALAGSGILGALGFRKRRRAD